MDHVDVKSEGESWTIRRSLRRQGHGIVGLSLVSSLMITAGRLSWWRSWAVMLVAPVRRSRLIAVLRIL